MSFGLIETGPTNEIKSQKSIELKANEVPVTVTGTWYP